ncbi:hypothetical protein NMY22_g16972 [Coprinellus aureogranulatus]|nr:hypothetical protein NMY22_g16972 [Coprinellus aureogranulatus]
MIPILQSIHTVSAFLAREETQWSSSRECVAAAEYLSSGLNLSTSHMGREIVPGRRLLEPSPNSITNLLILELLRRTLVVLRTLAEDVFLYEVYAFVEEVYGVESANLSSYESSFVLPSTEQESKGFVTTLMPMPEVHAFEAGSFPAPCRHTVPIPLTTSPSSLVLSPFHPSLSNSASKLQVSLSYVILLRLRAETSPHYFPYAPKADLLTNPRKRITQLQHAPTTVYSRKWAFTTTFGLHESSSIRLLRTLTIHSHILHRFGQPPPRTSRQPPTLDNYNPILGSAHSGNPEDVLDRSTLTNIASQAVHLPYQQITRPSSNNLDSSHPPSTTFAARLDGPSACPVALSPPRRSVSYIPHPFTPKEHPFLIPTFPIPDPLVR